MDILPPNHVLAGGDWSFWVMKKNSTSDANSNALNYEDSIIKLGTVSNAYEFWSFYSHLKRGPDFLKSPMNSSSSDQYRKSRCDFYYFRSGITPAWEDVANENGGKLSIKLKREVSPRIWEHLLLALSSGSLEALGICGVVWSMRMGEDIISVWNEDSSDEVAIQSLKEEFLTILQLPQNLPFEYKSHFKNKNK